MGFVWQFVDFVDWYEVDVQFVCDDWCDDEVVCVEVCDVVEFCVDIVFDEQVDKDVQCFWVLQQCCDVVELYVWLWLVWYCVDLVMDEGDWIEWCV